MAIQHSLWNPTKIKKDGADRKEPSKLIGENATIVCGYTVE